MIKRSWIALQPDIIKAKALTALLSPNYKEELQIFDEYLHFIGRELDIDAITSINRSLFCLTSLPAKYLRHNKMWSRFNEWRTWRLYHRIADEMLNKNFREALSRTIARHKTIKDPSLTTWAKNAEEKERFQRLALRRNKDIRHRIALLNLRRFAETHNFQGIRSDDRIDIVS